MEKKTIKTKETKAKKADYSANELVTIIATEKSKHLKAGQEYEVTGELANIIINKGFAKAK